MHVSSKIIGIFQFFFNPLNVYNSPLPYLKVFSLISKKKKNFFNSVIFDVNDECFT